MCGNDFFSKSDRPIGLLFPNRILDNWQNRQNPPNSLIRLQQAGLADRSVKRFSRAEWEKWDRCAYI